MRRLIRQLRDYMRVPVAFESESSTVVTRGQYGHNLRQPLALVIHEQTKPPKRTPASPVLAAVVVFDVMGGRRRFYDFLHGSLIFNATVDSFDVSMYSVGRDKESSLSWHFLAFLRAATAAICSRRCA